MFYLLLILVLNDIHFHIWIVHMIIIHKVTVYIKENFC